MSRNELVTKLEHLRTLETELWTEHREMQVYNLETFGPRDYDADEDTTHSRAAKALEGLLDGIEELLQEWEIADGVASAAGRPWGMETTLTFGVMLEALNANLVDPYA